MKQKKMKSLKFRTIRFYKKKKSNVTSFATAPYRDVCDVRVESLAKWEKGLKLDKEAIWVDFFGRIEALKEQTVNFIKEEKKL